MGAGKVLSIIGGILTLVGFFFLNWFTISISAIEASIDVPAGSLASMGIVQPVAIYGLAGLLKLMWFMDPEFLSFLDVLFQGQVEVPTYLPYIVMVVVILLALGGIFQLIGAKKRVFAILGALLPFLFSLAVILLLLNVLPLPEEVGIMVPLIISIIFGSVETFPGVAMLPFAFDLMEIGLGIWFMAIGSLLAIISGFMSRDDY